MKTHVLGPHLAYSLGEKNIFFREITILYQSIMILLKKRCIIKLRRIKKGFTDGVTLKRELMDRWEWAQEGCMSQEGWHIPGKEACQYTEYARKTKLGTECPGCDARR